MKTILFFSIILTLLVPGYSQRSGVTRADNAFKNLRYAEAYTLYQQAYDTCSNCRHIVEQLAECARHLKYYDRAEQWYTRLAGFDSLPSVVWLRFAQCLASNEKYRESAAWYERYYQQAGLRPPPESNFALAYNNLSSFNTDSSRWRVSFASVNSEGDDYSPAFKGKGLVFVTNRATGNLVKSVSGWNETPFTRLYEIEDTATVKAVLSQYYEVPEETKRHPDVTAVTSNDSKTVGNNSLLSKTVDMTEASVKLITPVKPFAVSRLSREYNGPASFSADGKWGVFTVSATMPGLKTKAYPLQLYIMKNTKKRWHKDGPFVYNTKGGTDMHPALSADGKVLFFASDRPGGYGGTDIYYSTRTENTWSLPVNLGPLVNTPGNEMFPFLSTEGRLYFASDGLAGLGGLDVFTVLLKDHMPAEKPKNMGRPVNSSKDDFGFIFNPANSKGYFSSNRAGNDNIYIATEIK